MNSDGGVLVTTEPSRRAVLRVSHDLDTRGRVIHVQLEPLPDVCAREVARAAWQAARRRHPWIVGDSLARKLAAAKRIALSQVNHLMSAADETLDFMRGSKHAALDRLREAVIDLRGYLPALKGELPQAWADEVIYRRVA